MGLNIEKYNPEFCYERYRLCSTHFEENMFTGIMKQGRLKKFAVPTLNLKNGKLQTTTFKYITTLNMF